MLFKKNKKKAISSIADMLKVGKIHMGADFGFSPKPFSPIFHHVTMAPKKDSAWDDEELDHLDKKIDALMEHLDLEFVTEEIVDGSKFGREDRSYMRKKTKEK